eukprot:8352652-Karenia_brevis.AAC.1
MDTRAGFNFTNRDLVADHFNEIRNIQGWSDGGCRTSDGISSYGWLLKAWTTTGGPIMLAAGSAFLNRAATSSLEVEALGMRAAVDALHSILSKASGFRKETVSMVEISRKLRRLC